MDRAVGVGSCRGGYVYDHGLSLGVGLRAREAGGGGQTINITGPSLATQRGTPPWVFLFSSELLGSILGLSLFLLAGDLIL